MAQKKKVYEASEWLDGVVRSTKSVAGIAKENIFEFPVFVSDSVGLDYATATNSLMEQIYASYLQMAISSNPVVNADTVASGNQFAAFKTNTNKYLECTDMTYAHNACHQIIQEGNNVTEFNMISIDDADAKIINEYCDHVPLSEFDHFFQEAHHGSKDPKKTRREHTGKEVEWPDINDTKVRHPEPHVSDADYKKDIEQEDTDEFRSKRELEVEEKVGAGDDKIERVKLIKKPNADYEDDHANKAKYEKNRADLTEKQNADYKDDHDNDNKVKYEKNRDERDGERANYTNKIDAPRMLDETKIQKLNTMKPLMMSVNLKVISADGNISKPIEYIVGVKTFTRIIPSSILPEVAEYPIKEMNKLSRKAKWRAGEIKFFEYLFKIKEKKQTAIDARDNKRKWYRRLYELAHSSNDTISTLVKTGNKRAVLSKYTKSINGLIPNATIVITNNDVINIKAETDIDLLKPSTAVSFCKELFLMSIVVVDVDAGSIKILTPDLHNTFEIHSMASVTKQLSMLDTSGVKTRDVMKLLG